MLKYSRDNPWVCPRFIPSGKQQKLNPAASNVGYNEVPKPQPMTLMYGISNTEFEYMIFVNSGGEDA